MFANRDIIQFNLLSLDGDISECVTHPLASSI